MSRQSVFCPWCLIGGPQLEEYQRCGSLVVYRCLSCGETFVPEESEPAEWPGPESHDLRSLRQAQQLDPGGQDAVSLSLKEML